jgi:hypothetical protein
MCRKCFITWLNIFNDIFSKAPVFAGAFLCHIEEQLLHFIAGLIFASSLKNTVMIEQQSINGRDVVLKVDPIVPERSNPNIIPREYFTVSYYLQPPGPDPSQGELIKDEEGQPKLFESPVAALTYARNTIERMG